MQTKLKECSDCGKMCKLWKSNPPLCPNCAKKPSNKNKQSQKAKEFKQDLNVFFASQIVTFPDKCENCGEKLKRGSLFDIRKQTCHILPKTPNGGFPTIAVHPENRVYMCCDSGCYGHSKWDNGDAYDRLKMPVYQTAILRYRRFQELLSEKDRIKARKYLGLD